MQVIHNVMHVCVLTVDAGTYRQVRLSLPPTWVTTVRPAQHVSFRYKRLPVSNPKVGSSCAATKVGVPTVVKLCTAELMCPCARSCGYSPVLRGVRHLGVYPIQFLFKVSGTVLGPCVHWPTRVSPD